MSARIHNILFLILVGTLHALAQSSPPVLDPSDYSDPSAPRNTIIKDRGLGMDMLPYELTRSVGKLMSVTDAERSKYEALRKSGNMKMLKMFSAPKCASDKLAIDVSSDECTAAVDLIRASFYSFRFSLYGETIADFRILEDSMTAGNGGFVHGIILDLGQRDLSGIDAYSPDAKSFFEMPIAKTLEEESQQRKDLQTGIVFGEKTLTSTRKLSDGGVYLVRIVSYNFKQGDRTTFDRDQLYLVKYVGMNADKVALILWRKLADKKAPKI